MYIFRLEYIDILTWLIGKTFTLPFLHFCGEWIVSEKILNTVQIFECNCTNMSEKLCLQWNDFQDNIKSAFGNLREDNDFTDVTLACEDGQQVEAHKVILAASSPFFQKLLGRNKHPHP